jgi:hypothetical protein
MVLPGGVLHRTPGAQDRRPAEEQFRRLRSKRGIPTPRPAAEKRPSCSRGLLPAERQVGIEEPMRNDHGISGNAKDVE